MGLDRDGVDYSGVIAVNPSFCWRIWVRSQGAVKVSFYVTVFLRNLRVVLLGGGACSGA